MRICVRCNTPMLEDFSLRSQNVKITLARTTKVFFPGIVDYVKVAVCPNCGEISTYVDKNKLKNE